MSARGRRGGVPEQIEADREPGPTTDEVLAAARRAAAEAWTAVAQVVGTSWKKPHAAALVHRRAGPGPPGTEYTEAAIWQSRLVGHLLAGLSAANRESQGVWGQSRPGRKPAGLKCSFCGKSDRAVERLIGGPGVTICNECVELCVWMLVDPD